MNTLSALQRDSLYIIAGEEKYGLAIKSAIEEYYETDLSYATFYPKLAELVEHGLIEAKPRDSRVRSYTLTQRGRDFLKERQKWENQQFTQV